MNNINKSSVSLHLLLSVRIGIFCHEYIHHFPSFLLLEIYQKHFFTNIVMLGLRVSGTFTSTTLIYWLFKLRSLSNTFAEFVMDRWRFIPEGFMAVFNMFLDSREAGCQKSGYIIDGAGTGVSYKTVLWWKFRNPVEWCNRFSCLVQSFKVLRYIWWLWITSCSLSAVAE